MKRIFVLVMSLFTGLLAEEIYASFDVFAINQSKLAFEVGGIVKEIKVSVSKQVKKGDILAKINIERFEDALEKKILRAPYDGIISAKYIDLAQGVAPVQQVVMEMFSYPDVKLVISFDEKFKDKVKVGQTYRYKINGEQKEAKITLVYPSIDIKTRKIFAEIYTTNLTPGLFGEGVIITP